ncbi:MAG: PAS domain S-box protein, partial [Thermomicrobiales bacterium]|nr:PAS domain S-box protein [Thermomicrobiales bacterium]
MGFALPCIVLIGLFFVLPESGVRSAFFPLFGCAAALAVIVGARRLAGANQAAWLCVAACQMAWTAGDAVSLFDSSRWEVESLSARLTLCAYLAGYPVLAAGFIVLLRRQRGRLDAGGFVDAMIVATGVGLVSWALAVAPATGEPAPISFDRVAIAAFPVLDLLVLTLIMRLLIGAESLSPALLLAFAGAVSQAAASALYVLRSYGGFQLGDGLGDTGWLFTYVAFGAAALHPSAAEIGRRVSTTRSAMSRVALLTPFTLVGPIVLALARWREIEVATTPLVVGLGVLTLLALIRVVLLLRDAAATDRRSREMLESIHDGFYALDGDWRFTFVNSEAERLLRRPKSELLGEDFWSLYPEIETTPYAEALRRVMHGRKPAEVTFYFPPLDGWYQVRVFPSAEGLSVYFLETTDAVRGKDALAASEERYRTVVEHVPVAIYAINCDDVESYGYLGPYIETILGYSVDAFVADPSLWRSRIHPDDRAGVRAHAVETNASGEPFSIEYRMKRRDGRQIWVHDTAVLVRDANGAGLYWQGAVTDITDRKTTQEALAARDARFRSFVQDAADLITLMDPDGTIRYESPAFERILGHRPEEWIGRSVRELVAAEDLDRYRNVVSLIAERPREAIPFQLRAKHADGTTRWIEGSAFNLIDDPNVAGIVVNSRDVTERVALDAELRIREARHRALLDAIPDVMMRFDRNGTYLDIKSSESVPLLVPVDELIGRTIATTMPDAVALQAMEAIARALDERVVQTFEYQLEGKAGTTAFEARMVADGEGEVVALIRDVTRRHAAEARVRDSEERLRLALEAAGIGAWDWHVQSDTVIWSSTLSSLLGLPPMARAASSIAAQSELVHPDDRPRVREHVRELLRPNAYGQIDYCIVRPDGEMRSLVDIGRLIERGPNDEPVRAAGVTIDVTAARAAANALRLRDSAIAAASSGIVIIDVADGDHRVLDVNPAFERMTGYTRDEIIGKRADLLFDDADNPTSADASIESLTQGGRATIMAAMTRRDGTTFWCEIDLSPVVDGRGRLINVVGILNDVSERRRIERQLRFNSDLLDTVAAAVISITPDGIVTHWNSHAEQLYGWERGEAIGRHVDELLVGAAYRTRAQEIRDHLLSGEPWDGEFVCTRKDGTAVDVHLSD